MAKREGHPVHSGLFEPGAHRLLKRVAQRKRLACITYNIKKKKFLPAVNPPVLIECPLYKKKRKSIHRGEGRGENLDRVVHVHVSEVLVHLG